MDREILFRGKRTDNGEWIEGNLLTYTDIVDCTEISENTGVGDRYDVDPQTCGQFTGLTDKNGEKIFEGDILECNLERFIVVWDDDFAGFYLDDIDPDYQGCETIDDVSKDGYIIGNIHDNAELLGNWREKKMPEIKLKPCPYCGGENVRALYIDKFNEEYYVDELDDDEANALYCYIRCNDCDIDFCPSLNSSNKIQETIEAWNRRTENGK